MRKKESTAAGKAPDFDFRMEALVKVLQKELTLRIHCHRADDIITAIRIAREFDIDISLEHCTEGCLLYTSRTDLYVASVSNFAEKALENGSPEPLGHGQVSNLTGKFDIHAGGFIGSDVRYGGGSSLNWDGETLYFSVTLNGAPYIYTAATDLSLIHIFPNEQRVVM